MERLCSVLERRGAERIGAERICSDEGISDALINSTIVIEQAFWAYSNVYSIGSKQ